MIQPRYFPQQPLSTSILNSLFYRFVSLADFMPNTCAFSAPNSLMSAEIAHIADVADIREPFAALSGYSRASRVAIIPF